MILNTCETGENETIVNSGLTDTNISQKQPHKSKVGMVALILFILEQFNFINRFVQLLKDPYERTEKKKKKIATLGFTKSKLDISR